MTKNLILLKILLVFVFCGKLYSYDGGKLDWVRDAVWYQIFPERFANGDPSNDPKLEDIDSRQIEQWKIRSWGKDWYKKDKWEENETEGFYSSVFKRRYGGDIQGIINRLDYLEELGITAIYLNPVFSSPSLHKYDARLYHHIDETFGPDPEGDKKLIENEVPDDPSTWVWTSADKLFLELLDKAHKKNIKIIIDGVFNHSSRLFFAFKDILKNKQSSKYVDWYNITKWDQSISDGFEYTSWEGISSLPEFKRDTNNVNEKYKKYVFDITERWMKPNSNIAKGVDGWRLDAADYLPHNFWKDWRAFVKSINPNAFITGEVGSSYFQPDEMDAYLSYEWHFSIKRYFIDKQNSIPTSEFSNQLQYQKYILPQETHFLVQNLISSHDTPRLISLIVNPDIDQLPDDPLFYHRAKLNFNPEYRIDKGNHQDFLTQKLVVLFQMTYIGSPLVYYGEEVGMSGANDPDNRKPMLWKDIIFEDENSHPILGKTKPAEENTINEELLNYYKKLIRIRNENVELRRGSFDTVLIDDENKIFVFLRQYNTKKVYVVLNNSMDSKEVTFQVVSTNAPYKSLTDESIIDSDNRARLTVTIPAKSGKIFKEEK